MKLIILKKNGNFDENTTRIPQISLSEIHEISSISVRFLEILLVLDEFQDVSLNSVGFQKISKILTDISENFKKIQKFSPISVGISKFQKISPISVKISKISRNLTDIGGNFKKFQEISPISVEISLHFLERLIRNLKILCILLHLLRL